MESVTDAMPTDTRERPLELLVFLHWAYRESAQWVQTGQWAFRELKWSHMNSVLSNKYHLLWKMSSDFYTLNDPRSLRDCIHTVLPWTADTILGDRPLLVILLTLIFCKLFCLFLNLKGKGDFSLKTCRYDFPHVDSIFLCGSLIWKLRIMFSYCTKSSWTLKSLCSLQTYSCHISPDRWDILPFGPAVSKGFIHVVDSWGKSTAWKTEQVWLHSLIRKRKGHSITIISRSLEIFL